MKSGKLTAGAAYWQHDKFTATFTNKAYRLSVNDDLPMVNVGAGFNRLNYNLAACSVHRDYFTVTASVPMGKGDRGASPSGIATGIVFGF